MRAGCLLSHTDGPDDNVDLIWSQSGDRSITFLGEDSDTRTERDIEMELSW